MTDYFMTAHNASTGTLCDRCGNLIRASIYFHNMEKLCRDCVPKQDVKGFFDYAAYQGCGTKDDPCMLCILCDEEPIDGETQMCVSCRARGANV